MQRQRVVRMIVLWLWRWLILACLSPGNSENIGLSGTVNSGTRSGEVENMPSALRYVPPDDKWRTNLTPSIINEKTARHRLYRRALKYYRGEHTKQLLFNPDTEPDDNVVINLVKTTADRTASFLFPEAPVFEIDPENPDETPEEAFIHGFIKANGGVAFLTKMAIRGFLS